VDQPLKKWVKAKLTGRLLLETTNSFLSALWEDKRAIIIDPRARSALNYLPSTVTVAFFALYDFQGESGTF
jgi:hypothetical protein